MSRSIFRLSESRSSPIGFMGVIFPEEYGGAGMGYVEYATIIEESLACGWIGLAFQSLRIIRFARTTSTSMEPKSRNRSISFRLRPANISAHGD